MEEIGKAQELLAKAQEQLSASNDTVERIRRIKNTLNEVMVKVQKREYGLGGSDNEKFRFAIEIIEFALGDDPSPRLRFYSGGGRHPESITFDLGPRQNQTKEDSNG